MCIRDRYTSTYLGRVLGSNLLATSVLPTKLPIVWAAATANVDYTASFPWYWRQTDRQTVWPAEVTWPKQSWKEDLFVMKSGRVRWRCADMTMQADLPLKNSTSFLSKAAKRRTIKSTAQDNYRQDNEYLEMNQKSVLSIYTPIRTYIFHCIEFILNHTTPHPLPPPPRHIFSFFRSVQLT